jgi:hypothetical protein
MTGTARWIRGGRGNVYGYFFFAGEAGMGDGAEVADSDAASAVFFGGGWRAASARLRCW